MPPTASSRSAFSELPADADSVGLFALLDFLMGSSIDDVTQSHRFRSIAQTEAAIRAVLLLHGYGGVAGQS